MKSWLPLAALLAPLALLACTGGSTSDSDVTETFSGTLQLRSSIWHEVTLSSEGTLSATLTSLASTAASVGLAIGDATNGCQRLTWSDTAQAGTSLFLGAEAGDYCVMLYDSGRLTEPASYTVAVTHP